MQALSSSPVQNESISPQRGGGNELQDAAATMTSVQSTPQAVAPATADASPEAVPATTEAKSKVLKLTDQTNFLPPSRVYLVFSGLSLGALVSCLDSTIVATALPTISSHFNAGSISSWVPSAYLLTSTAFQPLYGRFSDIFGRKIAVSIAMGLFLFGCLLAGFSRTMIELIILRGVAGVGGGGLISMGQIVISDIVTLRERGKYQGIIGVVIGIGYAIGPLIGGVLVEQASWRWCFWIVVPVGVVGALMVLLVLPSKPVEGNFRRKLLAVDYMGVVLVLGACTLVMLPLIWGGITFPWSSAVVLAPLICGLFGVSLFCLWEWKAATLPLVPMYIFKHVTVVGVYITMFINGLVFNSELFYLPQFFQVALNYSPIRSGVFLLPVLVSMTLASIVTGQMISRTGKYRFIIWSGFSIWAIGCGCLSTVTATTPKGLLVFYMLLSGLGAGQTLQTTTVAAQASVPRKDMSVVTAVRNFVRLLGGTLALAIGATVINNSLRSSMNVYNLPTSTINTILNNPILIGARLASSSSNASDTLSSLGITDAMAEHLLGGYTNGFRIVFILNAALAAVAVVASVLMIGQKDLSRDDEAKRKRMEELASEKNALKDLEKAPIPILDTEKEKEISTPDGGSKESVEEHVRDA